MRASVPQSEPLPRASVANKKNQVNVKRKSDRTNLSKSGTILQPPCGKLQIGEKEDKIKIEPEFGERNSNFYIFYETLHLSPTGFVKRNLRNKRTRRRESRPFAVFSLPVAILVSARFFPSVSFADLQAPSQLQRRPYRPHIASHVSIPPLSQRATQPRFHSP